MITEIKELHKYVAELEIEILNLKEYITALEEEMV